MIKLENSRPTIYLAFHCYSTTYVNIFIYRLVLCIILESNSFEMEEIALLQVSVILIELCNGKE